MSASRRYKICRYTIKADEISLCSEGGVRPGVEGVWRELGTLYIYNFVLVELDLE